MKPVMQTTFGVEKGNCMQACIASLLELSLEEVPNFMESGGLWWKAFREWVHFRGYSPLEINWPPSESETGEHIFPNEGQVCWAVGKSPRGDFKHAVLVKWKDGKWVNYHDPHPDKTGFDGEIELIGMLVKLNCR